MKLRLLTFNAGLLSIFGKFMPAPYVGERLAVLPSQISDLDADIILLQEVYGDKIRHSVAAALKNLYPWSIFPRRRRRFGLENGLMTFSRFPATGELTLFKVAPTDESFIDSKGFLVCQHTLRGDQVLRTINLHTTAGGLFNHPESPYIDQVRSRQLDHILEYQRCLPSPVVIAGDLNAGPGVSDTNYRQMLSAGLISLHDHVHGEVHEPTWDPLNPLNSGGPHKHCPPQRIDHVFVREADIASNFIRPISSKICLHEPAVAVPKNQHVTLSDHYGVCVEFELDAASIPFAVPA